MTTRQAIAIAEEYDRQAQSLENDMVRLLDGALQSGFDELEARVIRDYARIASDPSMLSDRRTREIMRSLGESLTLIDPENADAYIQRFEDLYARIEGMGGDMSIDLIRSIDRNSTVQAVTGVNVGAVAEVARQSWRDVQRYGQEFADDVVNIIGGNIAIGGNPRSAMDALRSRFGMTRAHAETMVRTRTMGALNEAANKRYEENGLQSQWLAVGDERMCKYCGSRNMKVYKPREITIPAHFRCRCTVLPWSAEWAELGLTDDEFAQDYYNEGIATMRAGGNEPDDSPTPFERAAGLTRSPSPAWAPGMAIPDNMVRSRPAPPPVPEPVLVEEEQEPIITSTPEPVRSVESVPDGVPDSLRSLYQAAIDGRPVPVTDRDLELAREQMSRDEYTDQKVERILEENPTVTEDEARAIASYISWQYRDMSRRIWDPSAETDEGTPAQFDAINRLAVNGLQKLEPVTVDYINATTQAYSDRLNGEFPPAFYDPDRGLTRAMTVPEDVGDALLRQYTEAMEGDGLVRFDTWFATSTMPKEDIEVAGGEEANFTYRLVRPVLDGTGQGRYVDHYKNEMLEGEVLYPPFSQFRVVDIERIQGTPLTARQQDLILDKMLLDTVNELKGASDSWQDGWREMFGTTPPDDATLRRWEDGAAEIEGLTSRRDTTYEVVLEEPPRQGTIRASARGGEDISVRTAESISAELARAERDFDRRLTLEPGGDWRLPAGARLVELQNELKAAQESESGSRHIDFVDRGREFIGDRFEERISDPARLVALQNEIAAAERDFDAIWDLDPVGSWNFPEGQRVLQLQGEINRLSSGGSTVAEMESLRNEILSRNSRDSATATANQIRVLKAATRYISEDAIRDAVADFFEITGGRGVPDRISLDAERATADPKTRRLNIGKVEFPDDHQAALDDYRAALFHELGHFLEFDSESARAAAEAFIKSRATGEPAQLNELMPEMNGAYNDYEVAYPGSFIHPYVGSVYEDGATEVISMGLERFTSPERMLQFYKQDPEHFALILGIILGD